jgi:NAD(P)-dependent dehydrogenase (short-subunit alcohol dehydrogenase family)
MVDGQIIVTGASKGIGAAIAVELDRRGLQVVCLSRSGDAPAGHAVVCDMTDERAVREAFAAIDGRGSVAGLVNNAGVHIPGPIAKLTTADFDKTLALNVTAVMVAAREAYPFLRKSGAGTIVNIGSFFDKMGVPDNLAYCASKAAVAAMSRCMAVEWAKDGIRVVNVAPGYIETDLNRDYLSRAKVRSWMAQRIPVGMPGQASDVARFVATLLVERVGFLTGETIYLDGGQGINH